MESRPISKKTCKFFNTKGGCKNGNDCKHLHENIQYNNGYTNLSMENKSEIVDFVFPIKDNEYYCKFCQFGNCTKKENKNIKIIHHVLTPDEKNKISFVWQPSLAKRNANKSGYCKALKELANREFYSPTKSSTRSKFTFDENANFGLLSIVIPVIYKGSLGILTPSLVYIFKDNNSIRELTWCKACMGAKKSQCPVFDIIIKDFKPTVCYHKSGLLMELAVTKTKKNELKIHSPLFITSKTQELKKIATSSYASEYFNGGCASASSEQDDGDIPLTNNVPFGIIEKHKNETKAGINLVYGGVDENNNNLLL